MLVVNRGGHNPRFLECRRTSLQNYAEDAAILTTPRIGIKLGEPIDRLQQRGNLADQSKTPRYRGPQILLHIDGAGL